MSFAPDEEITVEPYHYDPVEVVKQYMTAYVAGDKKALSFVVKEEREGIAERLQFYRSNPQLPSLSPCPAQSRT
mgnify:CR=1 FL=1